VHALANVGGLFLNVDEDLAFVSIKTDIVTGETNVAAGITNDLFVVDLGGGGDLAEDHYHVGFGGGFASDLGLGVLSKAGVEDCIRDLITDLVWMTLIDRFCKKEGRFRLVLGCWGEGRLKQRAGEELPLNRIAGLVDAS